MDKYKDRAGLVFISKVKILDESKDKFEKVMLDKGIINKPFEFKETKGNVTFFVCGEDERCNSAGILRAINHNMQLAFLNNNIFKVDALQAFIKEWQEKETNQEK